MDRIEPAAGNEQELVDGESIFPQKDTNVLALKGYFGIEHPTTAQEQKLVQLYELVTGGELHDMAQVLLFLRHTENKLGMTPLGTSRLDHVFQYLNIVGKIQDMTSYKELLEQ